MPRFLPGLLRKIFGRKKSVPRRKPMGGSAFKRVIRRAGIRVKPFMVKKTVIGDKFTVNAGTNQASCFTAELTDIPNYSLFTGLYDQYKILKVRVQYRCLNPVNTLRSDGAYMTLGLVHSAIDENDAVVPGVTQADIQKLMNDNTYRGTKTNRDHTRIFTPRWLTQAGSSSAVSKTGWIACDAANVSHYALKTIFEAGVGSTAGHMSYIVEPVYTYWIAFKDQKCTN